ncbi:MAG: ribosome biogenesis GTPase Der [Desulfobacterales bacterium]|nr:MAG: ribosome biogenesis GTPase Der [Desulfobacterales bacterium]
MQSQGTSIVALIGRPNVGKSTLFNRITGSRRALVDPTPGVTRDRQYERVNWKGQFFLLVDTGGIDKTPDDLMVDNIREQAMAALNEADVILFLMDGKSGLMPADLELVELLRRSEKKIYWIVNKVDGPEVEDDRLAPFYELGVARLWPVSAEHKYGFADLMDDLCEHLPEDPTPSELPEGTIRMAFFGRPNVGKSSMVNRILGEERMVVSDISGTTRDSVDTLLTHKKRNYLLIDTAGIRRKGKTREKLEKFSILKALSALGRCDIAVVLLDAAEGITEQDATVIGYTQEAGRGLILLVNKWDLVQNDQKRQRQILEEIGRAVPFVGFAPLLTVSALTGYGIKRLFPTAGSVFRQLTATFPTSALNRLLADAVEHHTPPVYKNKRLKFYYTSQLSSRPPTFVVMTNSYKGVHFSYERYLVNRYREGLGLDRVPLRLIFKDKKDQRQRRKR